MEYLNQIKEALLWSVQPWKRMLLGCALVWFPLLFCGYLLRCVRAGWMYMDLPKWRNPGELFIDSLKSLALIAGWVLILVPISFMLYQLPQALMVVLFILLTLAVVWLFPASFLMLAETHRPSSGFWFPTLWKRAQDAQYLTVLSQALLIEVVAFLAWAVLVTLTTPLYIVPLLVTLFLAYLSSVTAAYVLSKGWRPGKLKSPMRSYLLSNLLAFGRKK